MNQRTLKSIVLLLCCLFLESCNQPSPPAGGSISNSSTAAAPASSSMPEFNACTLFSVADAQQIMGAPMKVAPGTRAAKVCMYEEVTARPNSLGPGRISLTVNKRGSSAEENSGWARIKDVRHLEPGQKNVTALSGVGDEAWWDGHIEKGKIGVAGILAPKVNSDFILASMVIEDVGSPDALKAIAKRVAGQL